MRPLEPTRLYASMNVQSLIPNRPDMQPLNGHDGGCVFPSYLQEFHVPRPNLEGTLNTTSIETSLLHSDRP